MKLSIRFILIFLLFNLQNAFAQQNSLITYKVFFDNQLKPWTLLFKNFDLSKFKKVSFRSFDNLDLEFLRLDSFYSIYKPALTFSKDSNQFIDIYSYELNLSKKGKKIVTYGVDDVQQTSLWNIRSRKRIGILSLGLSQRIEEVSWISNTRFILVGSRNDFEQRYEPVIYICNTINSSLEEYDSVDPTCFSIKYYTSPKLKKLNIQEL